MADVRGFRGGSEAVQHGQDAGFVDTAASIYTSALDQAAEGCFSRTGASFSGDRNPQVRAALDLAGKLMEARWTAKLTPYFQEWTVTIRRGSFATVPCPARGAGAAVQRGRTLPERRCLCLIGVMRQPIRVDVNPMAHTARDNRSRIPSGVASTARSVIVQQFLRGMSESPLQERSRPPTRLHPCELIPARVISPSSFSSRPTRSRPAAEAAMAPVATT